MFLFFYYRFSGTELGEDEVKWKENVPFILIPFGPFLVGSAVTGFPSPGCED